MAPAAVAAVLLAPGVGYADNAALEQQLFTYTNQDRTSNGLGALAQNSNLFSIARSAGSTCGGVHVNGRSEDMIERSYFAHQIPPCNLYVWNVFNLGSFNGAGENIGWNNQAPSASASAVNTQFMNSPEHRANILGNYNQAGMGAWQASGSWTYSGATSCPCSGVIMFTEIFILAGSPPAPKPPPPPAPKPVPPPTVRPTIAPTTAPTQAPATAPPAATPSVSCPSPESSPEADLNSPPPSPLPSDGGLPPCPSPQVQGPSSPSAQPATITTTAATTAGSATVVVASATGLAVGQLVTISGAGPDGSDLVGHIVAIDGTKVTLDVVAARTLSAARLTAQTLGNEVVGADREAAPQGLLESVVEQVLRLFLNV